MGLIMLNGESYSSGNTRDNTKVSKSGDTMTGSLTAPGLVTTHATSPTVTSKATSIDASKANNNVSSDAYPGWNAQDSAGRILTRMEGVVSPSGPISAYWYVRNYNTSGTQVGQKGIRISMAKDGTLTYTVDDNSKFRTALGLATVASSGSYNDLSNKPTIPTGFNFLNLGESNHVASTGAALSSDTGPVGVHWYSQTGKIANQPTQYGFLLTCATSKGSVEQHSIFMEQANGSLYHMGTNGSFSGSPPAYKKIWDSGNAPYGSVSFTRNHASVSYTEGLVCNRFGNVVTFAGYFSCGATIAANTTLYSGLPKPAGGKHIYFTWSGLDFYLHGTDGSIRTNGQITARTYVGTFTYVCA